MWLFIIYYFPFSAFSVMKLQDSSHHDFLNVLKQLYIEFHIRRNNYERILDGLYDVLHQYIISFFGQYPAECLCIPHH